MPPIVSILISRSDGDRNEEHRFRLVVSVVRLAAGVGCDGASGGTRVRCRGHGRRRKLLRY